MSLGTFRQRPLRRRWVLGATTAAVGALIVVFFVASASGVLPGSPSAFEGGNDPTLGLGNMIVDNHPVPGDPACATLPCTPAPHKDWISVTGEANYVHLTDVASSSTDDSFTPGQKQDTTCPDVTGHGNPPKDDFTDVASFTEVASGGAHDGETYLYGATIRYTANGNASENVELKQSSTLCPGSTVLTVRTAGDKLLAIDYLGGGKAVQFHVLTWVTSGPCFVGNDVAPCWGATVLTLDPNSAEGGVNTSAITVAQNPISGAALVAGQFAEFGVNLALAGIIPAGSCKSFNQTVWESRSSGSSFVSSTKDIRIEDKSINNCPTLNVRKVGSDGGSQAGAIFTLYAGTGTGGTVIGTCTVDASGDCVPSFGSLQTGTYTLDETNTPAGYAKDPTLPYTFTLVQGQNLTLTFTDPALKGALSIVKNSTKGGAVKVAGAVFSYDGGSVTDNGAGDENPAIGAVCVSNLVPGGYTVTETSPPAGYGAAAGGPQSVTVVNGTNCGLNPPGAGATATFTNPPLSDIQVNFRDGGSGETSAVISCDNTTGTTSTTPASGWTTTETNTGVEAPTVVTCTITIDP
jgi:Prealbumin-like fold domain